LLRFRLDLVFHFQFWQICGNGQFFGDNSGRRERNRNVLSAGTRLLDQSAQRRSELVGLFDCAINDYTLRQGVFYAALKDWFVRRSSQTHEFDCGCTDVNAQNLFWPASEKRSYIYQNPPPSRIFILYSLRIMLPILSAKQ
jgi:hypothetical protein